jgi:uncharacterized protein (DUF58 family)
MNLAQSIARWSFKRHGPDSLPLTVRRNRIYILPTRRGLLLACLLIAMLIGGLNYSNNLALGLAFLLCAVALAAMHHCHRNLLGLQLDAALTSDTMAGASAVHDFALKNPARLPRFDIEICLSPAVTGITTVAAGSVKRCTVSIPAATRGVLHFDRVQLRTRYPFGWFRAWTYAHVGLAVYTAPQPEGVARAVPAQVLQGITATHAGRGDDDFMGLRDYAAGDPRKHIAWKSLARGADLAVRLYSGAGQWPEWFDWQDLPRLGAEQRLAQLCQWILAADSEQRRYGLRLPSRTIELGSGPAQRRDCLRALAKYPEASTA